MSAKWHTGELYEVIKTGEVGERIECPCDDPIILEFKDGVRDAFFLREVERSTFPQTTSVARYVEVRHQKGRAKGIAPSTVKHMLQIYEFLLDQSRPVYRKAIEEVVGFNITRSLMNQQSSPHTVTLESLGIVERIKGERTWALWILTEKGRYEGEAIITSLIDK